MSIFASKIALSGLSTAAFSAIRSAIQRMGGLGMLPSLQSIRDARAKIEALSIEDLGV
jgi:hypothetical protein